MREPELDKLEIFIGKWINKGYFVDTKEEIVTSDVYEWLPGKNFVLHSAYGRAGKHTGGGVEIIGYDPEQKTLVSYFFNDQGVMRKSNLNFKDGSTCTWEGETTGCTAEFTEGGRLQAANHIRKDENGKWVPSMEVVLEKII